MINSNQTIAFYQSEPYWINISADLIRALVIENNNRYLAGDPVGTIEAQYKLSLLRNVYNLVRCPIVSKDFIDLMGVNVAHLIKPIEHVSDDNQQNSRRF